MADEIGAQKEGMKHLNINNVRRSSQILLIQGIAITSLVAMYITWAQTYLLPTLSLVMSRLWSSLNRK